MSRSIGHQHVHVRPLPVRPVIAEPEPLPTPAPPLRVKLGEVMHLNGSIPRGVPLQSAVPHRCRGCSGIALWPGVAYCDECSRRRCGTCHGLNGKHAASCRRLKARRCRGCGKAGVLFGVARRYCDACREQQCPECARYAGQHKPTCVYEQRRRRPGLTTVYDVVTEQDIVAIFVTIRARAVRLAERICGRLHGEDVVSEVVTYLLERRAYLKSPPGARYFLKATRHGALRRHRYAWSRYTVAMDPEDIIIAEQMMASGRPSDNSVLVRLPGEVLAV